MKLKVQAESYPEWQAVLTCGNHVILRVPFTHYDGADVDDEAAFIMAECLRSMLTRTQ